MLHNATIPMSQLYSLSFTVIIMSPHKKKQTTKKGTTGRNQVAMIKLHYPVNSGKLQCKMTIKNSD